MNSWVSNSLYRLLIVCAWVVGIAAVLYMPSFGPHKSVVRVLAWGDIFDEDAIAHFEEQTGISVQVSYYATNEELLAKLKTTGGTGYDLIVPSDYAVGVLREHDLLKKLDKTKLPFVSQINPLLLRQAYDPDNDYSIPFSWEVFGIGYNENFFKNRVIEPSWKTLFEQPTDFKIIMTNDAVEAVRFAQLYLERYEGATQPDAHAIQQLLRRQRSWVEAYSSMRVAYYLTSGNSPVAFASSIAFLRAKEAGMPVGYTMPHEGGFITIENIALPRGAQREADVYRFINFMYQPEIMQQHYQEYFFFPALVQAVSDEQGKALQEMCMNNFAKLNFFKRIFDQRKINDIWVAVKS